MFAFIVYLASLLVILIFFMFMSVYTFSLLYSSFKGSPYVASKNREIKVILDELNPKRNKLMVELGSGDGRMLRLAAKSYGLKGVGIDVNKLLVVWSSFLAKLDGVAGKAVFLTRNIFDYDLTEADYVYIFLMPKLIGQMEVKLKKEIKKGAIVISHGFPIPYFAKKEIRRLERKPFPTYFYRV